MAALTPQSVLATLAQVDHDCPFVDAKRIAKIVNARAGDVQRAVECCEGKAIYGPMLAYAEALEEIANPARLSVRLMMEASTLLAASDKARAEADEFRRKAETWAEPADFAHRAACRERAAVEYLKRSKAKARRAGEVIANAALSGRQFDQQAREVVL